MGAWQKDSQTGAAYIYHRDDNGWDNGTALLPDNDHSLLTTGCLYGFSVAISDNYAMVSAPDYTNRGSKGKVFVYVKDAQGWSLIQKIEPPDNNSVNFGSSIAINGNYAVIGDELYTQGTTTGAAFVYNLGDSEWTLLKPIIPDSSSGEIKFGSKVAISEDGSTVLCAAPGEDKIYSYIADSFTSLKLVTSGINHSFELAMTGSMVLIGNPGDSNTEDGGSVYYYNSDLSSSTTIIKPKSTKDDQFGSSIAISKDGNFAVIGAPGLKIEIGGSSGDSIGGAFIYKRTGNSWEQTGDVLHNRVDSEGTFGNAVAIQGNTIIIGDESNSQAHIYE